MRHQGIRSGARAAVNVCVDQVDVRTGRRLRRSWVHNLVVDTGLELLRDVMLGVASPISHGAVGTDDTAPSAGDVELGGEVFRDSLSQKLAQGPPEQPAYGILAKFVVGSQFANGNTLREAGLLNAAAAGSLYARATPEAVVKTDAILVIYTWTVSWEVA